MVVELVAKEKKEYMENVSTSQNYKIILVYFGLFSIEFKQIKDYLLIKIFHQIE